MTVLKDFRELVRPDFITNLGITLYRTFIGFGLSFIIGTFLGLFAYTLKIRELIETTLLIFQVIPGTILGIILLLIFGIGNTTPIALIVILTTPVIAVNTSNSLTKRNQTIEFLIKSYSKKLKYQITDEYIPALIPTTKANLSIGFGFSFKIVILGEFIACENGLGYLLNIARIYFNMKLVFLYLLTFIIFIIVFQILINFIFILGLRKYLYPIT